MFHSGLINDYYKGNAVNIYKSYFTRGSGVGVDLFFSLSGFLITFLLLKEIEKTATVSVKTFYLKRILRIWPLYFVLGVLGVLVGPVILNKINPASELMTTEQNWINIVFLCTFTINFQINSIFMNTGVISTLWSVCIEEQFYILWAPLIKWLKGNLLVFLIVITLIGIVFTATLAPVIAYYFTLCRFLNFGIGALAAWVYYKKQTENKVLFPSWMFLPLTQIIVICVCILYLFGMGANFISSRAEFFINPIASTYVILIAIQPNAVINLENSTMKYLGKISYGLYMFHPFCVQIMARVAAKFLPIMGDTL